MGGSGSTRATPFSGGKKGRPSAARIGLLECSVPNEYVPWRTSSGLANGPKTKTLRGSLEGHLGSSGGGSGLVAASPGPPHGPYQGHKTPPSAPLAANT